MISKEEPQDNIDFSTGSNSKATPYDTRRAEPKPFRPDLVQWLPEEQRALMVSVGVIPPGPAKAG